MVWLVVVREVVVVRVTTGSMAPPSLSHIIIGDGLPLKVQEKVTSSCSNTNIELGLDSIVGIPEEIIVI